MHLELAKPPAGNGGEESLAGEVSSVSNVGAAVLGGERESFPRSRKFLHALSLGLTELCFPPTCVFCHGVMDAGAGFQKVSGGALSPASGLCLDCRRLISQAAIRHSCLRCGRQIPETSNTGQPVPEASLANPGTGPGAGLGDRVCEECEKKPGAIDRVFVLGMYREVLRESVVACKRMGYQPLAANLGDLLGLKIKECFDARAIGAVTYVPSHWTRRLRRGGVPTLEMARRVARVLDRPFVPLLKCLRRTEKQGMLTDKQRRTNVRGAFVARKGYALRERRILVVDDVWTTGSTLLEAAEQLSQGYDAEIFAAVIARAVGTHTG